ncbi:tyrosine-type recombinase/integrase [Enterobacter ludwigii]|uniref:tyrosine-type recombinase/integrase n=1 Tax=Enterobacter ludwigii TaxID=299767 RepID=UPI003D64E81D
MSSSKKITLQKFYISHVCDKNETYAEMISLQTDINYWTKKDEHIIINNQIIKNNTYNFFPIILNNDGSPWVHSTLFIIDKAKNDFDYTPSTYHCIISDLTNFKNFIDDNNIDLYDFPEQKLLRPTYKYRNYLATLIQNGKLSSQTVKRRVSTMISFYRFLIRNDIFVPKHNPWSETDIYVNTFDKVGYKHKLKRTKTDLAIKVPSEINPFSDKIYDEGRLRPLEIEEQTILIDILIKLQNTEMLLIHLIGLFTGARIQTVLTLKKSIFLHSSDTLNYEIRILTGANTDIDTKNNKSIVLVMPKWLYDMVRTYNNSDRALKRRNKTNCIISKEYLFLSNRGAPYYLRRIHLESQYLDSNINTLHNGEAVRQFIKYRVIPLMREKLKNPYYTFKYHDLRATFGMNLTSSLLENVNKGKISLHDAREYVKNRMGHSSSTTTDLYLNYRSNLSNYKSYQEEYELHLQKLISKLGDKS